MILNDVQIRVLQSVSNTILGMQFDHHIPPETRECLIRLSHKLDEITDMADDE